MWQNFYFGEFSLLCLMLNHKVTVTEDGLSSWRPLGSGAAFWGTVGRCGLSCCPHSCPGPVVKVVGWRVGVGEHVFFSNVGRCSLLAWGCLMGARPPLPLSSPAWGCICAQGPMPAFKPRSAK